SPRQSSSEPETDPFSSLTQSSREALEAGALGLGVCQGIIQSHGGEIRFRTAAGTARFEIDLPLSGAQTGDAAAPATLAHSSLTLMLVDPDLSGQRALMKALSGRGHRIVPSRQEEAADLAQRMRFDAVFWALRPNSGSLRHDASLQERVRTHIHAFVLVADAYDAELARSLEHSGQFLLARPVEDAQLDRVLQRVESLAHSRS
ncbi:MAG TPA: hypothetical protein VKS01_04225, partial [Bryobacteraceae bacterium]|nr:hypothetical protein [Bryobacteraceae bacterium]